MNVPHQNRLTPETIAGIKFHQQNGARITIKKLCNNTYSARANFPSKKLDPLHVPAKDPQTATATLLELLNED